MGLYRKKQVTIWAVQFTQGMADAWVLDRIPLPDGVRCSRSQHNKNTRVVHSAQFDIETLEGRMQVSVGDWIITGVKGERYACKPDVFDATYDYVGPSEDEVRARHE